MTCLKIANSTVVSLFAAVLLVCPAKGGPVKRADIGADPAWVVHLDLDKLKSTTLGKFVLEELKKPDYDSKLSDFTNVTGVDPREALHGATLYSPGNGGEDAVAVIYGDFDGERLVSIVRNARDYESKDYQKHVIHSWLDEKKAKDDPKARTYGAIHGKRVLFASKEASVRAALDVLDERSGNLSKSETFPAIGKSSASAFLQAASRKFPISEGDPNAEVLKQSKGVGLEVGEADKQVTAKLKLDANSEEVAKNIASIGQGLIALLKMQKEKPLPSRLGEALSLEQQGGAVEVKLALPSAEVVDLLKSHVAKKAKGG